MIPIIDKASILSRREKKELGLYIIENCKCTLQDVDWLKHIIIRDDGLTNYAGYWTISLSKRENRLHELETAIVLNSRYLLSVVSFKRILAHEYGHNWTLGYLYHLERINDHFKDKAPRLYYRIRRLNYDKIKPNYSRDWKYCDKEIMAEDYRILFTNNKTPHKMKELTGNPSSEVASYLQALGKQKWE